MLGASPPAPANAASVHTTPTTTITPPPRASVIDTAVSNGVAKLKCEGTPRHACMLISTVSTTQVAMNTPEHQAAGGQAQVRGRPRDRGQREAEREPERRGLAQRHRSDPRPPRDQQDADVHQAADEQHEADDVRHPLDPPSVDPDPPQCSPELGHDDILPLDVKRSCRQAPPSRRCGRSPRSRCPRGASRPRRGRGPVRRCAARSGGPTSGPAGSRPGRCGRR